MSQVGSLFGTYQALLNSSTGVLSISGTPLQIAAGGSYSTSQVGDVVLSLPQNIAQTSSPTFYNLQLTSLTAGILGVDNSGIFYSNTVNAPLGYDSVAHILSLAYNTTNLKVTASQLNTVQDIAQTSSPTYAGLNLTGFSGILKATAGVISGSSTTSNLPEGSNLYYTDARARSALSKSDPITYNSSTGAIGLGYNASNLQITAAALDTIQGISTASSPSFTGLTLANQYLQIAGTSNGNTNCILSQNITSMTANLRNVGVGKILNNTVTGTRNVGMGIDCMTAITSGSNNTMLGDGAGFSLTTQGNNSCVGQNCLSAAGASNCCMVGTTACSADYSCTLGYQTLSNISNAGSAIRNIGIGYRSGYAFGGSASENVILGHNSCNGVLGSVSNYNVMCGNEVLRNINGICNYNVLMGYAAGYSGNAITNNTMVGYQAGKNCGVYSTGNVFLGSFSGYNETGNNKLYISNSNTASPLIKGDFAGSTLTINGSQTTTGTLTLGSLSGVLKASTGLISGSATTSDLPEGTNLYYTSARVQAAITGTLPISVASGVVSLNYNNNLRLNGINLDVVVAPSFTNITTSSQAILSGSNANAGYTANTSVFVGTPTQSTANNAVYGGITSQPYFTTAAGQTNVSAYGLYMYPNLNPNAGTISNYYGIYSSMFSAGSGSITNAYGGYFVQPGSGTNRTALYADSLNVGVAANGVPSAGDLKCGVANCSGLFVGTVITNCILSNNASMTAGIGNPAVGNYLQPTLAVSSSNVDMYAAFIGATYTTNTFYTGNTYGLYIDSMTKIGTAVPTNSYGLYVKTPSIGTKRAAIYADSLNVGVAASTTYTTGTIQASSTITGSNLNLSGFTFANSLACAATTYSSTWTGLTGGTPTFNFTLTRFGYIVMMKIGYFIYPSTQVGVIPYCGLNPGGWAPAGNTVIPIIANHGNAYIQCCLLVNTNCTFYLYGPRYPIGIDTTNGGQSFPGDCVVSWSMY